MTTAKNIKFQLGQRVEVLMHGHWTKGTLRQYFVNIEGCKAGAGSSEEFYTFGKGAGWPVYLGTSGMGAGRNVVTVFERNIRKIKP